jgi:hypothetical protein
MRQPDTAQKGAEGEEAVALAFVRLGWGAVKVPREYDLGTDLLLLVRDERRFDPGLVLGAQIKSGPTAFEEPRKDESGQIIGWWFRDDDRQHMDYWLDHSVPHVIVLHDLTTGVSYWAAVTPKAVESTGKGAKVFVPVENTIDINHRDALLRVAATVRTPPVWEGSAWSGSTEVAPVDILRYALLVPRLVAPHRNTQLSHPLQPEQIIGLLVEARLNEVDLFRRQSPAEVPSAEAAADSQDWTWRFVAAVEARMVTNALEPIQALIEQAPDAHRRAAASSVAAAVLLETAQPDDAIDLLRSTLTRDDSSPVDHAWLTLQLARAYVDTGQFDIAKEAAEVIQTIRLTHAHDVTATAIAGTAAVMLYTLANLGTGDTAAAITGMDTTAVWWRFIHVAGGAAAAVEREFTTWTKRTIITVLGGDDTANNELFVASILASHLGDHQGWRTWESLNIQQAFLEIGRTSTPRRVADLLTRLRLAGDQRALEHAVGRLVIDGPSAAITAAAAQIDFTYWTRTTGRTNLALLEKGGDVLDASTAEAAVKLLLATLTDQQEFRARTRPTHLVALRLVDALAGIVPAAVTDEQRAVAELIIGLPAQADQVIATSWARVVYALPDTTWTADRAARAAAAAGAHHDVLRRALLRVAVAAGDDARQQLLVEVQEESLDAFATLNDARAVSADVASMLIDQLEPLVRGHISRAQHGSYDSGGLDAGRILAVLNAVHGEVARWEPLYDLLEEPMVAAAQKRTPCDALASWAKQLPAAVRNRLREIAIAMTNDPVSLADPLGELPDALGPAASLVASLNDHDPITEQLLIRLLAGNDDHRLYATKVAVMGLDPQTAIGVLNPLIQDPDAQVRAAAASALAYLVAEGTENSLVVNALRRAIVDPGTLVPHSTAGTLRRSQQLSAVADELLHDLASHPSAAVRDAARHACNYAGETAHADDPNEF